MRIGVIPHLRLDGVLEVTKSIINYLSGEEVIVTEDLGEEIGRDGTSMEEMDVDAAITIGGDGTVLYALQKLSNFPILGINMGKRGFLADVKPGEISEALEQLKKDKLEIMEMEKLSVKISGKKFGEALNEGVLRSAKPTYVIPLKITLDGELVERIDGDGLVVSTPRGSTAYSMAAGGPILDPRVEANVVTTLSGIAAKTMPLVYPTSSKLEVDLEGMKGEAELSLDGQIIETVGEDDVITFTQSENKAKFYKWNREFYEGIREKL